MNDIVAQARGYGHEVNKGAVQQRDAFPQLERRFKVEIYPDGQLQQHTNPPPSVHL
jgi:hypothetical protein